MIKKFGIATWLALLGLDQLEPHDFRQNWSSLLGGLSGHDCGCNGRRPGSTSPNKIKLALGDGELVVAPMVRALRSSSSWPIGEGRRGILIVYRIFDVFT
jgi:hypothetical protein